ncbi:MAG TPA: response regulator [Pyrinomonadaceae bacterium]|nr:response regulator [Pyrinomonadaceae bacterium]
MLAGRKLLLADDSATIQKVIDLTFADEGVRVVAVGSGREAIDQLLEVEPDIVLADVFMPSPNGYEVCEYVKTNEKLKHIPVVLLVGSFEPFDEAEARRVGADDILTKPFQSIRRLIDRVGALVSSPPVEKESPTAELPKVEEPEEEALMDTYDLEVTTADTIPLDDVLKEDEHEVEQPVAATESLPREETMKTETRNDSQTDSDVLLDLGEFEPVRASSPDDDFVLDLDEEPSDVAEPAYAATPVRTFVEPQVKEAVATAGASYESTYQPEIHSAFADTQEVPYSSEIHDVAVVEPEPEPVIAAPEPAGASSAPISADSLSPEMIDAIARRVVEMMSDKVVREIAWEVVPDLAELLIKQQLEEKAK